MARENAERLIEDVGRRVAEIRHQRGWTQEEAAEALSMPLKNYQRLESGRNLTIRSIAKIASGLDVPARALFDSPSRKSRVVRRGRPKKG